MNKKQIGLIAGFVVIVALIWHPWKSNDQSQTSATVQEGLFETSVEATGELKALKALDIKVPEVSFNDEVDIWAMKILSIVEEGKIVKKGDEVAKLEPTEIEENLARVKERLNELYTFVEDAKIDSSLQLSAARENIQKRKDEVIDAELKVEQSVYESKAIQRQTNIEYEKAIRSLVKSERDLITKTQKHKYKIARNQKKVERYENKKRLMEQLRSELTIKSPADGMVIYGIAYNGQKVKVGSRVGRWMPLIATLPDLSTLISEIQVKEIDIAKIKIGQDVKLKIDAFPKKVFDGKIISIANVGQEIPGEFQNGFKVNVELRDINESILPGMTTTNTIITNSIEKAIYVDKTAIRGNDSLRFVLKKDGMSVVRQEVKLGEENEEAYHIVAGLNKGDKVVISTNEAMDDKELIRL